MDQSKKRLLYYSVLAVLALVLLVLSCLELLDSFWAGMGGALLAVSAFRIVQVWRYCKDPAFAEQLKVKNTDERNRFLAERARSWTFYICILAEALAVIVLKLFALPDYSTLMGFLIGIQLVIYWVTYFILKRKY